MDCFFESVLHIAASLARDGSEFVEDQVYIGRYESILLFTVSTI